MNFQMMPAPASEIAAGMKISDLADLLASHPVGEAGDGEPDDDDEQRAADHPGEGVEQDQPGALAGEDLVVVVEPDPLLAAVVAEAHPDRADRRHEQPGEHEEHGRPHEHQHLPPLAPRARQEPGEGSTDPSRTPARIASPTITVTNALEHVAHASPLVPPRSTSGGREPTRKRRERGPEPQPRPLSTVSLSFVISSAGQLASMLFEHVVGAATDDPRRRLRPERAGPDRAGHHVGTVEAEDLRARQQFGERRQQRIGDQRRRRCRCGATAPRARWPSPRRTRPRSRTG